MLFVRSDRALPTVQRFDEPNRTRPSGQNDAGEQEGVFMRRSPP